MEIHADLEGVTVRRVASEIRAEMARYEHGRRGAKELAEVIGVTPRTAGRRLNGTQPFNVIELAKVADWLGINLADLFARAESSNAAA